PLAIAQAISNDGRSGSLVQADKPSTKSNGDQSMSDDMCSWSTCDQNVYQFLANPSQLWGFTPCQSCAGPGQKCENATVCRDDMYLGFDQVQNRSFPPGHPRKSTACALNTQSKKCINAVYQFCCLPGSPGCGNTDVPTCTAGGCAQFVQRGSAPPGSVVIPCPFLNTSATCDAPACKDPWWVQEITADFLSGKNNCRGPSCSKAQVGHYHHCPGFLFQFNIHGFGMIRWCELANG
ncbi:hypothetical protein AaE_006966, partial [Aphanomyces astaci]